MSKKQVRRERHRNERSMDEAFAALERGEKILALRLARRSRENGSMNPRILFDHARIARECDAYEDAEESLRAAIVLAPNFKEAYVLLAELQAWRTKWPAAVRLMARAVALDPRDQAIAARLQEWRQRAPDDRDVIQLEEPPEPPSPRIAAIDPAAAHTELLEGGRVRLPAVCTAAECELLRAAFASGDGFDRVLTLSGEDGAHCRARWSLSPLPPLVAALQRELYPLAADLANRTQALLGITPPLPLTLRAYRRARNAGGRAAARLLALAGDESMPTEPPAPRQAYPLRLLVDLGPGSTAPTLRVIDVRPGKKVRSTTADSQPGDAFLFCNRARLQQVGGVPGLQLVAWSAGPFAEERLLLDLPFDDA